MPKLTLGLVGLGNIGSYLVRGIGEHNLPYDLSFINDILSAVRRWRFPSITEGVVIVTYPMIFYRAQ